MTKRQPLSSYLTTLFGQPTGIAFIDSTKIEAAKEAQIDANWVIQGIKALTEVLIKSEDPKAAFKGYELAGKHLKLFTENVEVKGEVQFTQISRKIV